MPSLIPTNHDLIARLLRCTLTATERQFLQERLGAPMMTVKQFDWMHRIARRHKKKLQSLKREVVA